MQHHLAAADDKAAKADAKAGNLQEQLAFKSRFVLVFGEIDDQLARRVRASGAAEH